MPDTLPPNPYDQPVNWQGSLTCDSSLLERVTFTLGPAIPLPAGGPGIPPPPPLLNGQLDLSVVGDPGFLQLFADDVGDLGTDADGFELILSGVSDAVDAFGAALDAMEGPLDDFADILSFFGQDIPSDVTDALARATVNGNAALAALDAGVAAYTVQAAPSTPPATPPAGGGGGNPIAGGGGGNEPCDPDTQHCSSGGPDAPL